MMTGISRNKGILFLVLFFLIYNLFFINKAFHIDDSFTVGIARWINRGAFDMYKVHLFSNPILLGYYYAPIIRLFGESEMCMHIFHLPFSLVVIVSMYFLVLRFVGKTIFPALLLAISPAFLIMSQNVMLDIPMLALFLCALVVFISGIDKHDDRLLFISGLLAAAAMLIKYSALLLIPIMLFYAILHHQRRACLFIIIPIALFCTWFIYNMVFYKQFDIVSALLIRLQQCSPNIILKRIFGCLSFISGTSVSSIFLLLFLLRNKNNLSLFAISLPVVLLPFILKRYFIEYTYMEKFFLSLLFVFSLFIIFIIFKTGLLDYLRKAYKKDGLFLSFWFFIFLVFNIFCQFISARFILLLFPPMFLILHNELFSAKAHCLPIVKKTIPVLAMFTFLLSTVLAIGDYHLAGIYRSFAKYLKEKIPPDKKVYSCSFSRDPYYAWGYSYYLRKYYPLIGPLSNYFEEGFFIAPSEPVLPMVIENLCMANTLDNRQLTKIFEEHRFSYVFLHNQRYHTGFYSYDWGLLPFKITLHKSTLERFYIYQLPAVMKIDNSVQ